MKKEVVMKLWNNLVLEDPWFLLLLLLLPLFIYFTWFRRKGSDSQMTLPFLEGLKLGGWKPVLKNLMRILSLLAFAGLVIAMARPQEALQEENITSEGIDIVLAVDVSGSMLARDFEPDRLGAAKNMGIDFVDKREFDRIGLVVFAGESFTQCPITADHQVIKKLFSEVRSGLIEDGTAIGMGLATSVSRLKDSKAESKVVILMTDGVNNSGFIDPITAAETAEQFSVKVYTIGVGTEGNAPYPVKTMFGTRLQQMEVNIDEDLLKEIAEKTGGQYFRATDNNSLQKIYDQIDKLEKTEIEVSRVKRRTERFYPFVFASLFILGFSLLLNYTLFRKIN